MQAIGSVPRVAVMPRAAIHAPALSMTEEEARTAWERENLRPRMTPAQAAASGEGLGPPSGSGRADNSPEKVHTEIKVNGNVVARTYNSGVIEIAEDFRFLSDELGDSFANDTIVGPDLAAARASRVKAALERHGMVDGSALDAGGLATAAGRNAPLVKMLQAATAQTQAEWLEMKAKEPPMPMGSILSISA